MRARNIKPGFYKNEDLLKCEPLARILFSGLWCLADRDGRLEDRPMKIKIEVLPCDNCDANILLSQLHDNGLIIRYKAKEKSYIEIPQFIAHQRPHSRELASKIPPYITSEVAPRHDLGSAQPALNPESPILNPETLPSEGGDSDEPPSADFKKSLFTEGLKLLGGKDPNKNRSLVGRWLRDYGEQAVVSAFLQAQRQSALEPKAYIEKTLKAESHAPPRPAFKTFEEIRQDKNAQVFERLDKKYANPS